VGVVSLPCSHPHAPRRLAFIHHLCGCLVWCVTPTFGVGLDFLGFVSGRTLSLKRRMASAYMVFLLSFFPCLLFTLSTFGFSLVLFCMYFGCARYPKQCVLVPRAYFPDTVPRPRQDHQVLRSFTSPFGVPGPNCPKLLIRLFVRCAPRDTYLGPSHVPTFSKMPFFLAISF